MYIVNKSNIVLWDEQGTYDWHYHRMGVVTASNAAKFAVMPMAAPMPDSNSYSHAKIGKVNHYVFKDEWLDILGQLEFEGTNKTLIEGEIRSRLPPVYTEGRNTYMCDLAGQVNTGEVQDQGNFKACEWGKEHEPAACQALERELMLECGDLNIQILHPSFIYRDEYQHFGISPDGVLNVLYNGKTAGVELKCPKNPGIFVDFVTADKIKQEYMDQCQFSMWVTGYDQWIFAKYDPRSAKIKLHKVIIERDPEYMAKYDSCEPKFISDMDEKLKKMKVEFGDQWTGGGEAE